MTTYRFTQTQLEMLLEKAIKTAWLQSRRDTAKPPVVITREVVSLFVNSLRLDQIHDDYDNQLPDAHDELLAACERLVLAFDVGDMKHTTINGRGYAALAEARAVIAKARGEA